MKHALKLTAMLAAVLMLAACHKEKELTPDTVATTQVRDITYTVADRTTTVHLETDTEFEALLVQFCNYAQQGDSVTFYNANRGNKGVAAKDVATYSTTNREEMIRWMRQMEEAGKTVTVAYDPNTGTYNGMAYTTAPQPDPGPAPFNSIYVPLGELLTGEWELATDTIGWIDVEKWGAFLRALGVTGYLTPDNSYTLPELPWQGLINTIGGFTSREHPILKVNMTFENGIMHIDRIQYQYTYDENDNLIGFDSIQLPIQTDFTIDIENECRIRFTPIDPAQWYPTHNQDYENKLVICSLDSNRFVTVYDNYFGSREGIPTVSLYRRVR